MSELGEISYNSKNGRFFGVSHAELSFGTLGGCQRRSYKALVGFVPTS
jgi:hypothetical protein